MSILLSVGIISYNNLQINSRDAKRKTDLAVIQSSLEQYHADQGFYPALVNTTAYLPCAYSGTDLSPFVITGAMNTGSGRKLTNTTGRTGGVESKVYLQEIPLDPQDRCVSVSTSETTSVYWYAPQPAGCDNGTGYGSAPCINYCLYARMENTENNVDQPGCNSFSDFNGSQYGYEVAAP